MIVDIIVDLTQSKRPRLVCFRQFIGRRTRQDDHPGVAKICDGHVSFAISILNRFHGHIGAGLANEG